MRLKNELYTMIFVITIFIALLIYAVFIFFKFDSVHNDKKQRYNQNLKVSCILFFFFSSVGCAVSGAIDYSRIINDKKKMNEMINNYRE